MFLKRYVYITLPTPLFPTKKKTRAFWPPGLFVVVGLLFFPAGTFLPILFGGVGLLDPNISDKAQINSAHHPI